MKTIPINEERGVKFFNRYAGFLIALFHAPKLAQNECLYQGGNFVLEIERVVTRL